MKKFFLTIHKIAFSIIVCWILASLCIMLAGVLFTDTGRSIARSGESITCTPFSIYSVSSRPPSVIVETKDCGRIRLSHPIEADYDMTRNPTALNKPITFHLYKQQSSSLSVEATTDWE